MIELLITNPFLFFAVVGIVGLMVGSFLNVVIYRLPIMMKREWRQECAEYLGLKEELVTALINLRECQSEIAEDLTIHSKKPEADIAPLNLSLPLSHCPCCKAPIKAYQNIPVISYVLLRGKCATCGIPISLRYPVIEALTAVCAVVVALHFGFTLQTGFALLLTFALIALSFIDIDHQLLPDSIIFPMLWLGLLLSLFNLYIDAQTSILGAVCGYLSLWLVYKLFKLITGKEGMGYGDFKLLALFGAWLGWQSLPLIILLSAVMGLVVGISLIVINKRSLPYPYGPSLAIAGWIALLWGNEINHLYLKAIGL